MIRRSNEFRIAVVASVFAACFLLLAGRLWQVQVSRGEEYTTRLRGNSQVNVRLPAVRGQITDRHGLPLAGNRASNAVEFYLPDMVRDYRNRHGDVPRHNYRTTVGGMLTEKSEPDIVKIVNETAMPRLAELGLARDYNAGQLRLHFRNNTEVPYLYLEDLDFETMARVAENGPGIAGINFTVRPVRRYVYGSLGAHFLGYVGAPNEIDKEDVALQMAMVAATVANGGTSYDPRIVDRIIDQTGEVIPQEPVKVRADLRDEGLAPEQIETVRRGMWDAVNRGGGT
ncbi:MAG: penicillin-binding transpeptidase domain-containing protein, partial [Chthoniobacterales bacterium]